MIKYNPDRQQHEAWYINWLDEPTLVSSIFIGASGPAKALWEKEWGARTKQLQELHDLIKAAQHEYYDRVDRVRQQYEHSI